MVAPGVRSYSWLSMPRRTLCIVSVLFIAGLGVFAMFARDLANARARLVGRSSTLATSFGTLEYAEIGQGEPVLVVHGAAGGFDQALDMAGALAEHGNRLIAPSRFGYLRSSLPDHLTTAAQADAYVELLDHLGIAKANVVSISAGAWSALQLAIRHPDRVRALVLLVPADYLPPGTTIHGGAIVRAIFNSDFIAWAALKVMPSAEDDRFGTARRARLIVGDVANGRLIVFSTGGHALVGHVADTVREVTAFMHAVSDRPTPD